MEITLSNSALSKLQTIFDPNEYRGLRIAIKGAGCSGMQYVLEWSKYKNIEDKTYFYRVIFSGLCKIPRAK